MFVHCLHVSRLFLVFDCKYCAGWGIGSLYLLLCMFCIVGGPISQDICVYWQN